MTADFLDPEEGGDAAREAASMRWKAVQGFNGAPGLSPAERRVGIALICAMDAKTRLCYPSEIRLAALCDLHPTAVKKAKAALKVAGLIDWGNPGWPRHPCQYTFDFHKLEQHAAAARQRADIAVETKTYQPLRAKSYRGQPRPKRTRRGTNGTGRGDDARP